MTKKKIEIPEGVSAFEISADGKAVSFKIEQAGLYFMITRSQGSGFRPCGKDGLWNDQPHLYRNQYLAEQALAYFSEHS
jgi:hypothetical protein